MGCIISFSFCQHVDTKQIVNHQQRAQLSQQQTSNHDFIYTNQSSMQR